MRDVRKIGRRTWIALTSGGALAVWTGLKLGGRDGWAVSIGMPPTPVAQAQMTPAEFRRVQLGANNFVSAYVVVRGSEAAIVDTGVSGSAQRIGEVVQEAGLGWDAVRHLIVTHHHGDHAGSVGDVLNAAQYATVWAGAADIPSIRSPRTIMPADDGTEIFGLRVVATPGHTLGHISVIDDTVSTFITGDAVNSNGGVLSLTPARNTVDMPLAIESVRKMAALGFERALFMHGEPIDSGAAAALGTLASRLPNDAVALARYLEASDADCCHA